MSQQTLNFNGPVRKVINCDSYNEGPEQSKDDIVKARVTPNKLKRIDTFCRGRRISRSEYLRHLMTLDERYFDLVETLNQYSDDFLITMLENLPKKF